MSEPENLVLVLLREMRAEMATKADLAELRSELKSEIADVKSEVGSLRADVASDMILMEKRLGDRIAHLNRAVIEYHSSAIGHGILFTELEERIVRLEKMLNVQPPGAH